MEAADRQQEERVVEDADVQRHVAAQLDHAEQPRVVQRGGDREGALGEVDHAERVHPQLEHRRVWKRQQRLERTEDHDDALRQRQHDAQLAVMSVGEPQPICTTGPTTVLPSVSGK